MRSFKIFNSVKIGIYYVWHIPTIIVWVPTLLAFINIEYQYFTKYISLNSEIHLTVVST